MPLIAILTSPRLWPLFAVAAALALLGAAHAFEYFGHLTPCELCLAQRNADWTAAAVGLIGWLAYRKAPRGDRRSDQLIRLVSAALALVFLAAAGLGAYHAGVEWKWWPGPAACTGTGLGKVTLSDLAAFAKGAHYHVVRCDEAQWRMFGVSMAGYNAVISLGLAGVSAMVALSRRK
jgi:disulfide bond formation protein DsbB